MVGSGGFSESDPRSWELLSEADKAAYLKLKQDFNEAGLRHNRNTRLEQFDGILEAIRQFAERRDGDDWRRFLVCGVCWIENGIAINTRQLRILLGKCKSSINGSLQKMGYTTNASHSQSWKILFRCIPLLKDRFSELRQWTIRYKTGFNGPVRFIPIPVTIATVIPGVQQPPPAQTLDAQRPGKQPSYPLKFRGKMTNPQEAGDAS
jgi:hypothetical protein